ncbi:MAG TPA: hypothetical protein DEP87_01420 [Candidatus Pacebacteria bacterium]|nr:hypothetical protein [Candidatus Paceibacterota bacterium]
MKTRTVGEVLQSERINQKISLETLATQSRIKLVLLEALEANEFTKLPAAVYVKGYIKAYARLLGFDSQPVVALLRRDFKESARGQLVPREFLKPTLRRRPLFTPMRFLAVSLIAGLLTVFGYVAWQWRGLSQPPLLVVTQPVESAQVAAKVTVKGLTQPDNVVWVQDQPVALKPDGSFTTDLVLPVEGLVTIKISATNRRGQQTIKERTVVVKY